MIPLIGPIISLVTTGVQAYADQKKLKAEHKQAIEQAKIDRVRNLDAADADWDRIMAQNSGNSWKDEWFTILLSIPAIMSFIPTLDVYVKAGFAALNDTPDWYKAAFLTAVAASFGMRQLAKWKMK